MAESNSRESVDPTNNKNAEQHDRLVVLVEGGTAQQQGQLKPPATTASPNVESKLVKNGKDSTREQQKLNEKGKAPISPAAATSSNTAVPIVVRTNNAEGKEKVPLASTNNNDNEKEPTNPDAPLLNQVQNGNHEKSATVTSSSVSGQTQNVAAKGNVAKVTADTTSAAVSTGPNSSKYEGKMDVDDDQEASSSSHDEAELTTEEELPPYDFGAETFPDPKVYIYANSAPPRILEALLLPGFAPPPPPGQQQNVSQSQPSLASAAHGTPPTHPYQASRYPDTPNDPYSSRASTPARLGARSQLSVGSSQKRPSSIKSPAAAVKPIKRLAKVRPYANQDLPVMAHEIRGAIPKDASSIFHVLDRRVNMDSLDAAEGTTNKDVNVPVYALLRAWVQDDPYRQIPPCMTNLLSLRDGEDSVDGTVAMDDASVTTRKRGRDDALDGNSDKKQKATVDAISILVDAQEGSSTAPSFPSADELKKEIVLEAKETRKRKNERYKRQLNRTLLGLRQRGIHLG